MSGRMWLTDDEVAMELDLFDAQDLLEEAAFELGIRTRSYGAGWVLMYHANDIRLAADALVTMCRLRCHRGFQ